MRMEMVSFAELVLNPVAQVKFVHTVASGYVCGAMFVLGISSYYMLRGRDFAFAKRSFAIAASFGMAAILSVIVLGDESGYEMGDVQKTKLAAIEAEWETQPAPAAFTLFGVPDRGSAGKPLRHSNSLRSGYYRHALRRQTGDWPERSDGAA